jgi:hypothetical protein
MEEERQMDRGVGREEEKRENQRKMRGMED